MLNVINPIDTPDNHFHDGNPASGELGTIVVADWLNDVQAATRVTQSELIAVLTAAGIAVNPANSTQLLAAIRTLSGADLTAHIAAADPHAQYAKKVHTHTTADVTGLDAALAAIRMYRPGQMVAMFCATPPSGTLVCNGGAISRALYADLFAAIGTKYGAGDGSTTFNVPNIADNFALLAANGSAVGSTTAGSVISHSHTAWTDNQGYHNHSYTSASNHNGTANGSTAFQFWCNGDSASWTSAGGDHTHNVGVGATGSTNNYAAGMRLLICIAY